MAFVSLVIFFSYLTIVYYSLYTMTCFGFISINTPFLPQSGLLVNSIVETLSDAARCPGKRKLLAYSAVSICLLTTLASFQYCSLASVKGHTQRRVPSEDLGDKLYKERQALKYHGSKPLRALKVKNSTLIGPRNQQRM